MSLREQIEALVSEVGDACDESDVSEDELSKLADCINHVSRDLIAAIARGEVDPGDLRELCAMVSDANQRIDDTLEELS